MMDFLDDIRIQAEKNRAIILAAGYTPLPVDPANWDKPTWLSQDGREMGTTQALREIKTGVAAAAAAEAARRAAAESEAEPQPETQPETQSDPLATVDERVRRYLRTPQTAARSLEAMVQRAVGNDAFDRPGKHALAIEAARKFLQDFREWGIPESYIDEIIEAFRQNMQIKL